MKHKAELIDLGVQEFVDPRATVIMELLRKQAAIVFGVTVIGPYVTLRFGNGRSLVTVSMQVTNITDSTVVEEPDSWYDK